MKMIDILLEDIIVVDRFRKDLGDLSSLAESIKKNGLIEPIVISDKNKLLAGERRLEALKLLGLENTTVQVLNVDGQGAINIEYEENEQRKNFTYSEKSQILEVMKKDLGVVKGGVYNKDGSNQHNRSIVPDGTIDQNSDKKYIRKENVRAIAVGFKNKTESTRVRRIVKKGIPRLVDLLDKEEISIAKAYDISTLSEEDQEIAISSQNRQPAYSEDSMEPAIMKALQAKKITKDEAIELSSLSKKYKWDSPLLNRKIMKLRTDKAKVKAEKIQILKRAEYKREKEQWMSIEVSKENLQLSMKNVMDVLGFDKKVLKFAIDRAYTLYGEKK